MVSGNSRLRFPCRYQYYYARRSLFLQSARVRNAPPIHFAGLAAILFLAIHNLVDFNLTQTSISLNAAVVLTLIYPHQPSSKQQRSKFSPNALACIGILTLAWSGLSTINKSLHQDTRALASVLNQTSQSWDDKQDAILEIVNRHPADYYLPLMVANHAVIHVEEPRSTLMWSNRGDVP